MAKLKNEMNLDDELLSLDQTLRELIEMGLVESVSWPEENGIGPITRYYLASEAPAKVPAPAKPPTTPPAAPIACL